MKEYGLALPVLWHEEGLRTVLVILAISVLMRKLIIVEQFCLQVVS